MVERLQLGVVAVVQCLHKTDLDHRELAGSWSAAVAGSIANTS